jgi:hypothetical protein
MEGRTDVLDTTSRSYRRQWTLKDKTAVKTLLIQDYENYIVITYFETLNRVFFRSYTFRWTDTSH